MAATALSSVAHYTPTLRFATLHSKPRHSTINTLSPPSLSSSLLLSATKFPLIVAKPVPHRCSKRITRAMISLGEKLPLGATLTHYDRNVIRSLMLREITHGRRVLFWFFPMDCYEEAALERWLKRYENWSKTEDMTDVDAFLFVAVNGAWTPKHSLAAAAAAGDAVYLLGDENGDFLKVLGFPTDLKDNAKKPIDIRMSVEDDFVSRLRYGRGYENFMIWERS